MPYLGAIMLVAQLLCAVHVARSGRPYYWIYIIVFVPVVGMGAYFLVEMLPEITGSRPARQAARGLVRTLDPSRRLRDASRQVHITPTAQNKAALAAAYLDAGHADDAVALYREVLTGIHATDPVPMLGLARALFASGDLAQTKTVLEELRKANPGYGSPEGHLLYARCLDQLGETDAALFEYRALTTYYPGQEARCRYALLLARAGCDREAKEVFTEICESIELGPRHQYREQREWYDLAKRELSGRTA